jgi:hypothetical protein
MTVMKDPVTFLCTIAPLQSGIQITGDGNGLRLKIDVPESEMGNAIRILEMRNEVLRVTVELETDNDRYARERKGRKGKTGGDSQNVDS